MVIDYLQGDDYDIVISNGDLVSGESTEKHQNDLILINKGDQRILPVVGIGIANYINDDEFGSVKSEIQKQFELDGMRIDRLRIFEDGTTDIKAEYR